MRANEFIVEADSYSPPTLNVGDWILKGKFKNSPAKIKALTLDEQVQPELTNGEGFEHTVDRNGITLEVASNGHGALQIKAFVQGKKAGEAYFEMTPDNQHIASDDTHVVKDLRRTGICLLYTSPSPRD